MEVKANNQNHHWPQATQQLVRQGEVISVLTRLSREQQTQTVYLREIITTKVERQGARVCTRMRVPARVHVCMRWRGPHVAERQPI